MSEHQWHTRYFRSLQEVEYVFGISLTGDQQEAIFTYLFTGIRPDPAGCWTCNAAAMRKLTGRIDRFEDAVDRGEEPWPWYSEGSELNDS